MMVMMTAKTPSLKASMRPLVTLPPPLSGLARGPFFHTGKTKAARKLTSF
jgi:hypothetical protein